jgi:uncharacterized protein (TIGR00369 family)
MDPLHFRKLENMYRIANINTELFENSSIRVDDGTAEIQLEVSEKYFHALNAVHGSVYFKLLDDAAYFAVNSIVRDVFVLTTSFNLHLIRPITGGALRAVGKVRFKSRDLFIAEATLFNEQGKEVAFGTGHFAKSKIALSEVPGYQ